ncbi:meiotic cell cortex C-terminal pleckstrin homology-domain-containing protein [Gongronella butleri]|nr:meiotic cell cortex C-terminal pleckstrin homology-domain-containing protein [Gongronella butleri]
MTHTEQGQWPPRMGQTALERLQELHDLLEHQRHSLQSMTVEHQDAQQTITRLTSQLRQRADDLESSKEDIWNLELAKQEVCQQVDVLQQKLQRALMEQQRLAQQEANTRQELDALKQQHMHCQDAFDQARHDKLDLAITKRRLAVLQGRRASTALSSNTNTSDAATANFLADAHHQNHANRMSMPPLSVTPSHSMPPISSKKKEAQQRETVELQASLARAHDTMAGLQAALDNERAKRVQMEQLWRDAQETIEKTRLEHHHALHANRVNVSEPLPAATGTLPPCLPPSVLLMSPEQSNIEMSDSEKDDDDGENEKTRIDKINRTTHPMPSLQPLGSMLDTMLDHPPDSALPASAHTQQTTLDNELSMANVNAPTKRRLLSMVALPCHSNIAISPKIDGNASERSTTPVQPFVLSNSASTSTSPRTSPRLSAEDETNSLSLSLSLPSAAMLTGKTNQDTELTFGSLLSTESYIYQPLRHRANAIADKDEHEDDYSAQCRTSRSLMQHHQVSAPNLAPPPSSWRVESSSSPSASTSHLVLSPNLRQTASTIHLGVSKDNLATDVQDPHLTNMPASSSNSIRALTTTMIGTWMWKYPRKWVGNGLSHKRQRRFVWLHPYSKTLYWSHHEPGVQERYECHTKSVLVESFMIIDDCPAHVPSFYIQAASRSIKIQCMDELSYSAWFKSLKYLLIDAPPLSERSQITSDDVNEPNASQLVADASTITVESTSDVPPPPLESLSTAPAPVPRAPVDASTASAAFKRKHRRLTQLLRHHPPSYQMDTQLSNATRHSTYYPPLPSSSTAHGSKSNAVTSSHRKTIYF